MFPMSAPHITHWLIIFIVHYFQDALTRQATLLQMMAPGRPHGVNCDLSRVSSPFNSLVDYFSLFSGCTDKAGNPVAEGGTWEGPCGTCTCVMGSEMCLTAQCGPPESHLCKVIYDAEVDCCPRYECPAKGT